MDLLPYKPMHDLVYARDPADSSAERAQRYRQRHRRVDYKPSAEAMEIIRIHMAMNPGASISRAIDSLLLRAQPIVTSNGADCGACERLAGTTISRQEGKHHG